jgi:SHAQKYF class myb-like DNA-binding protein
MLRKYSMNSMEDISDIVNICEKGLPKKGSLEDIAGFMDNPSPSPSDLGLVKKGSLEDISGVYDKEMEGTELKPFPTTNTSGNESDRMVGVNESGFQICGVINAHKKPCQRIGKCPFHSRKNTDSIPKFVQEPQGIKKKPYKSGWTKVEHSKFLLGISMHGRGSWKQIAQVVETRTPSQIQSHAQKYFLRQQQTKKSKRSIHDFTVDDFKEETEGETLGETVNEIKVEPVTIK